MMISHGEESDDVYYYFWHNHATPAVIYQLDNNSTGAEPGPARPYYGPALTLHQFKRSSAIFST